jgi:hemerythrin-like domain-containing protein
MKTVNEPLADARDMFAAHTMFRREFGLMPGLVLGVTAGDERRAAVVADHIALVSTVLEHHHRGEYSFIWPPLLERCPQDLVPIVGVMDEQHEAIHRRLALVEKSLMTWHDGASADARNSLADAIDGLLPVMREHLALEEERVVPLIEKYVTQAEYRRVAQGAAAGLSEEKLPIAFGMFMYETAPEVIDMVVAEMPAEVQPVIRDVAADAYAAYAKKLYGTAAPARITD